MTTKQRPYALIRPCPKCPFRTDVEPYLRKERAAEIATNIQKGAEFPCHETTEPDPVDESEMRQVETSKICAGSLIVMEKQGTPNQMARIAERMGVYDPTRLDMDAPVYESFVAWQRAFLTEEETEREPCNVVNAGCEAPAGYMAGDGVVEGTEFAEFECYECGTPVCGACSQMVAVGGDDVRLCDYCAEREE